MTGERRTRRRLRAAFQAVLDLEELGAQTLPGARQVLLHAIDCARTALGELEVEASRLSIDELLPPDGGARRDAG